MTDDDTHVECKIRKRSMLLMSEVTNEAMPEFIDVFIPLNYWHNAEFESFDIFCEIDYSHYWKKHTVPSLSLVLAMACFQVENLFLFG